MKNEKLLAITLACMSFLVSIPASASSYLITFYERNAGSPASNLFNDFVTSGTATFEINDTAVAPNKLVLFSNADFLAFDATMATTLGNGQFTLGADDFPPVGDGTTINKHEQGILFDALGQPLRFDTPATAGGNTAQICDPSCTDFNRARLFFWDDDTFDTVFLNDGTITSLALATGNGDAFTRFNGEWAFSPLDSISQTPSQSYYLISAVPIPPALLLFGSGMLGLFGMARRKANA